MKRLLFLSLFISTSISAQTNERTYIQFVDQYDSTGNCKRLFFANGYYKLKESNLIEVDIPNTLAVTPSNLTFNNVLRVNSFSDEAAKMGLVQLDRYPVVPISEKEIEELIKSMADSADYKWRMHDRDYLRTTFGIVEDAEPFHVEEATTERSEPMNGIIDGAYIVENKFVQIPPNSRLEVPDDFQERSEQVKRNLEPRLDSLFRPFYFSMYEVTNREYREFLKWVSDSVELHMAYGNLPEKEAIWLLDCSNSERKKLNATEKEVNLRNYGLTRKNRKKIGRSSWGKATKGMYYPMPERFYNRTTRDPNKLVYKQSDGKVVSVFPDTAGFTRLEAFGSHGPFIGNLSWHPKFADYPIVNITFDQMMAYCDWKQQRLNEQYKAEGYSITVRPPTISEYEFALKEALGSEGHYPAMDQSNDHFSSYERYHYSLEFPFYQAVHYDPFEKVKKKKSSCEPSLNYKQWYSANQQTPRLRFLNGNVSELVIDTVTESKLEHYNMHSSQVTEEAHFVLGSNYIQGVNSIGDDQYNAVFFKTTLENGTSSPLVGFRLVYQVNELK